jgi:hypothetical protein
VRQAKIARHREVLKDFRKAYQSYIRARDGGHSTLPEKRRAVQRMITAASEAIRAGGQEDLRTKSNYGAPVLVGLPNFVFLDEQGPFRLSGKSATDAVLDQIDRADGYLESLQKERAVALPHPSLRLSGFRRPWSEHAYWLVISVVGGLLVLALVGVGDRLNWW